MTARFFRPEVAMAMIGASAWVLVNQDTGEKVLSSDFTRQSFPDVCWWHIEDGRVMGLDIYKKQTGPIWNIEKVKPTMSLERRLARAYPA
jgi:hypothetical protein